MLIVAIAVVIELLQDSKEQTKQRMNMQGYGVALFTFQNPTAV